MSNILVASLGESPIVVTAMYNLLQDQENIPVDSIMVVYPEGEDVQWGYFMIEEALKGKCGLNSLPLRFKDVNGESESYEFLQLLALQLQIYQRQGDAVYLSLAGGRKNMSALMALIVPFFPCVKRLYHVLDADEVKSDGEVHQFKTVTQLRELSQSKLTEAFFPPLNKILPVKIPYGDRQHISNDVRSRLFSLTADELDDLWDEDPALAEATEFYLPHGGNLSMQRILAVEMTVKMQEVYERMQLDDSPRAERFATCFRQMRDPNRLIGTLKGSFSRGPLSFHIYKRRRTVERPFYHTEPQSIELPKANVEKVIISGLAIEQGNGKYEPPVEKMLTFPLTPTIPVSKVLAEKEVALIVPLGTTPMVATQLYALLQNEGRTIREVVVIYPANQKVRNSARVVKEAFAYENPSLTILDVPVEGMKDITCEKECTDYQKALEATIDRLRDRHQGCEIVLSLSGGRKSMAALAMFAAQNKGIRYIYHTLIKDSDFSEEVENKTSVAALRSTKVSDQVRNDRLFLRAYQDKLDQFVLFKVPVVPSGR